MNIEYSYYDLASKDTEVLDAVNNSIKLHISSVSVLAPHIKLIKNSTISSTNIQISSPIDFPLGIMDSGSRLSMAEQCFKNGANILDVVCPTHSLCNRKYDKFREDIKNMQMLAIQYNGEIRYILEYRQFTYELLYKVSQILFDLGITTIYPSTGYFLDDMSDNILASALINKKVPNINIVCTGNLWNENQIKVAKNSKIYGLRVNSLNALRLLTKEKSIEN